MRLSAYPNQTSIFLTAKWSSTLKCKTLTLKDVTGRLIATIDTQLKTNSATDMSNYESGVYSITLYGTSINTLKITKE